MFGDNFLCGGEYESFFNGIGLADEDLDFYEKDESSRGDPDYVGTTFRSLFGGFTRRTLHYMYDNRGVRRWDGDRYRTYYYCTHCNKSCPRKFERKKGKPYITIDHKISVKSYWYHIKDNPSVPKDIYSLNEWYNRLSNLQLMCCSCNSQKGG
jgi:hypothetical protein